MKVTTLTYLQFCLNDLKNARCQVEEFTAECGLITSAMRDVARAIGIIENKCRLGAVAERPIPLSVKNT